MNNTANNFGGGIYSEFKLNGINNIITGNKAGIMGGGIYIPKYLNEPINCSMNCTIRNNKVNSYNDDYSSIPYSISLSTELKEIYTNITTGTFFPLLFRVNDIFGNKLNDVTKYYSSMILKVILKNENFENVNVNYKNSDFNSNYDLKGNIVSLINGQFDLKNFQIYADHGYYYLQLIIENFKEIDLKFEFDDIKIYVSECSKKQVKMYNNKNILYCENPICHSNCPVDISAECIPGDYTSKISTNDINKNICMCYKGWTGTDCRNKIFIDFK